MALIRRILASRVFRLGFVALTLAFGVWYIAEKWGGIHEGLNRIGPLAAFGAVGCVLAALVCTMLVWRVLLAGLGSPLSVSAASRVLFVGQLGKYLPGAVSRCRSATAWRGTGGASSLPSPSWYAVSWICYGLQVYVMALRLGGHPLGTLAARQP